MTYTRRPAPRVAQVCDRGSEGNVVHRMDAQGIPRCRPRGCRQIDSRAMFEKVLVANRGEIAIRVMRTLKEMGIVSVGVYSEADRDAPHVGEADEAHLLGPPVPAESYLNIEKLLETAEKAGAEAMGSKTRARELMAEAGVPIVPGTTSPAKDGKEAKKQAKEIGYPVACKA